MLVVVFFFVEVVDVEVLLVIIVRVWFVYRPTIALRSLWYFKSQGLIRISRKHWTSITDPFLLGKGVRRGARVHTSSENLENETPESAVHSFLRLFRVFDRRNSS